MPQIVAIECTPAVLCPTRACSSSQSVYNQPPASHLNSSVIIFQKGRIGRSLRKTKRIRDRSEEKTEGCQNKGLGFPYNRISVVDDLAHEIREEDGLGDDGEPSEQVTDAQTHQLWGHLEHGEPQQLHGGLHLTERGWAGILTNHTDASWEQAALDSHLSLFALRVPAGGVGVSAAVSVPPSAAPPVSGLHVVKVIHAARRLDEQGGVSAAVAVTVASDSPVVGESAGRLAVESVAVAWVPDGGSRTGSWNRAEQVRKPNMRFYCKG